ncbi:glycosyltransferase [Friedmanniella luteola]|nr:glycosyltransferase [Friedmanniella luteola]
MSEQATAAVARRSVLVLTVVHHPEDSRVRQRQIETLLRAGWDVTYVAPFSGYGLAVPAASPAAQGRGRLELVDICRSQGRHRLRSALAARRMLRELAPRHDLVLVHDPELLFPAIRLGLTNLVWDVHEDPAAAMRVKTWVPLVMRVPMATAWRSLERLAEHRHRLFLSEYSYQHRFRRHHPVVPNAVRVPATARPPSADRVSYLGSISMARGCAEIIAVARELRRRTAGAVTVEVIGEAVDTECREALDDAMAAGDLTWFGYLPSETALERMSGSLAGLCLLKDLPNFRSSLPTKIVEYAALGIPAITTPLPLASSIVRGNDLGIVVPWDDVEAVVDAVLRLRADRPLRETLSANGRRAALRDHDWNTTHSRAFLELMEKTAESARRRRAHLRVVG